MKQLVAAGALALLIGTPAFACGPTMSGPATSTSSSQQIHHHKRQKWVKKRLRHLEGDMAVHEVITSDGQRPSREVTRQFFHDRMEYLALKQEQGTITPKEKAELRSYIQMLQGDRY